MDIHILRVMQCEVLCDDTRYDNHTAVGCGLEVYTPSIYFVVFCSSRPFSLGN